MENDNNRYSIPYWQLEPLIEWVQGDKALLAPKQLPVNAPNTLKLDMATEIPEFITSGETTSFSLSYNTMRDVLSRCLPISEKGNNILNSIAVNDDEIVAIDGHRLVAIARKEFSGVKVVIPDHAMRLLNKVIKKGDVHISYNSDHVLMEGQGYRILCRPYEAKDYPDYRKVIGNTYLTSHLVDPKQLAMALRPYLKSAVWVRMSFNGNSLVLSNEKTNIPNTVIEATNNGDWEVCVNVKYLNDAIKTMSPDRKVWIGQMKDDTMTVGNVTIKHSPDDGTMWIIMPIVRDIR
ncbi:MAG: hypothetical protein ACK4NC_07350 [Candidatus Gracilibacteria bacterium]